MLSIFVAHMDCTTPSYLPFDLGPYSVFILKPFTQSSLELVGSLSSAFDMLEESTEHKQDGASDASQTDCGSSLLSKGAQLFSLKSHVPTAWIWHLICLYPQRDEGKS